MHLNGLGQYKLSTSLQGAVLRSLRLLHRTPNWGFDCVLAYNSVILCHFICCDIFYRAFDLVLLHYSYVSLSFMSCSISHSFHGCLITLALVAFWVTETYTTRVYNLIWPLTSLGVPNCTRYFVPLARSLAQTSVIPFILILVPILLFLYLSRCIP